MPFVFGEDADPEKDDFYSLDYESEKKKGLFFDPLTGYNEENIGKKKKLGVYGDFISPVSKYSSPKLPPKVESKTITELTPLVTGNEEFAKEYGWWRGEKEYVEWLNRKNLAPDKLDDATGNKLFLDYIKDKAENPEGFFGYSRWVGEGIGNVMRSIGDVVSKVPGVKAVAKPVGSVMQFIGNLFDAPRNILAGAFTAISSGHPDEILGNMFDALKFSVGAAAGNGQDDARYFSWMDGQLRNLTDKARQGMGEKEYKEYVDSDSFRQTKRLWQAGGMLLDLVLDPAWLIGAAEMKALKSAKELKMGNNLIEAITKGIMENRLAKTAGEVLPFMQKEEAFMELGERISNFHNRSEKLLSTIADNVKFSKAVGFESDLWKAKKLSNIDAVTQVLDGFKNMSKVDTKPFEYAMRFRIPFTAKETALKVGPSIQPLVDAVRSKIGGEARGILSVISRGPDRANIKIGTRSQANEIMYRSRKAWTKALEDVAGGSAGAERAMDAKAVLSDAERFDDLVAAGYSADPGGHLAMMVDIPTGNQIKAEGLFGTFDPLLKTLLDDSTIKGLRTEVQNALSNSKAAIEKAERANYRIAKEGFRMEDEIARDIFNTDRKSVLQHVLSRTINFDEAVIGELERTQFDALMKHISEGKLVGKDLLFTKEGGKIVPTDHAVNLLIKTAEPGFKEELKNLSWAEKQWVEKSTDIIRKSGTPMSEILDQIYWPRVTTEPYKNFIKKTEVVSDDPIHAAMLSTDPPRSIYIPVEMDKLPVQEALFGRGEKLKAIQGLVKSDPEMAFLEMNDAIQRLAKSDNKRFIQLTEMSNQVNPKTGELFRMSEVPDALRATENVRPLISQSSISQLNSLSKRGLIVKGFNEAIYVGGETPFFTKLLNDQKKIERWESLTQMFVQGTEGGWMQKIDPAVKLGDEWKIQNKGILRGYAVIDYLEKPMQQALKGLFGVVEAKTPHSWLAQQGLDALERFGTWWKVNIYLKNLGAHGRNLITNRLMMWGDRISPFNIFSKEGQDARKIYQYNRNWEKYQNAIKEAFRTGKDADIKRFWDKISTQGLETINIGGKNVTLFEASEEMMRLNVSASGLLSNILDDLNKPAMATGTKAEVVKGKIATAYEGSKFQRYNPLGVKDKWAKAMGTLSGGVENALGRNEYFLTLVNKKGYTMEKAAARVNEMMVDYARFSKTEGALRKYVIPFYLWKSRMIPNMLIKAIEQPAYFTKLTQIKNNMYNMLDLDRNFAPKGEEVMEGIPYLKPTDAVKFFQGKPLNEIQTQYLSGEGWLPQAVVNLFDFNGLNKLLHPIQYDKGFVEGALGNIFGALGEVGENMVRGGFDYVVEGVTPMIKTPVELVTGYSFAFKRPLRSYPNQTVRYLGSEMTPEKVLILRSTFGILRYAEDLISTWDKNAITGRPKNTFYDVVFKNVFGYNPYHRDEIREINGALGELKEIYKGNLSDARRKIYDKKAMEEHAYNALSAAHGIKVLEWYKEFATEVRDKEATIKGIAGDLHDLELRLQNIKTPMKIRTKLIGEKQDLIERMVALQADLDR